jgi:hydroxyethylthiazole kinase-like uncharacterized protein yjeF
MSDEFLTCAQMRAVERAAMDSGGVSGVDLMERAGRGVVAAALERWPALAVAPGRALVLCGPGNNGGDGFVVARLLRERGWAVVVFLLGDPARLSPDAAAMHALWHQGGGEVLAWGGAAIAAEPADLVVDAVFGAGLVRPVAADILAALAAAGSGARRLAIDCPTGLCMDSRRALVEQGAGVVPADLTVTFHRARPGHHLADGPALCGALACVDIGLAKVAPGEMVRAARARGLSKDMSGHKYTHCHALVLSGPMGRSGAARLAARGALRVGAGLVTVAAPGSAMLECASQLTAIMLRRCDDGVALAALLGDDRINALCLGPGLGTDARAAGLLAAAQASGRSLVLDADALTMLGADPALFGALHRACVLTPHDGEFARLFPDIAARLVAPVREGPAFSRIDAARAAAARAGCIVLLKGPATVIADPAGRAVLNAATYGRAAPWLATAGAGDVLAGLITGLLARGLAPLEAAEAAAWLHVEAARRVGAGLVAEDLPEALPHVLNEMEKSGMSDD